MNFLISTICISLLLTASVNAQKLVDPSTVAPEYREAAAKRRAEQLRQQSCTHRAEVEKTPIRDRAQFIMQCMEAEAAKQQ